MKIALAQLNTTVGDFAGNLRRILEEYRLAGQRNADLVVFPELTLTGYPPKDLLDRPDFIEANLKALTELTRQIRGPACVVGFVERRAETTGRPLSNAAALIAGGKIIGIKRKRLLPTYDVFDEGRYFEPGNGSPVFTVAGQRIGISICEDIWTDPTYWGRSFYSVDPIAEQAEAGAEILINISASPYAMGRGKIREGILEKQAKRYACPVIYLNLVGGNDDLIFDGSSLVLDEKGRVVQRLASFAEETRVIDLEKLRPSKTKTVAEESLVLDGLVMGLKDYLRKCGFSRAVLGLSGGIDSALTAWIACRALGADKVLGVAMPSPYSSKGSLRDAEKLAKALRMEFRVLPIEGLYQQFQKTLRWPQGKKVDVARQNLQARIRGNLLMALSNQEGRILLTTGNKSELSVGYCTLYGDMAGGFAVLMDVPKTLVYRLARVANKKKKSIPEAIFRKPPSAELAPGQTDQDDLPPYKTLDAILKAYIEERKSPEQIVAAGFKKSVVVDVLRRLDQNEYKRMQAPPGIRITSKAFGYGWRLPIANRYRARID
jgi:NAD+ synthase (glutamine-hydrolysing)